MTYILTIETCCQVANLWL